MLRGVPHSSSTKLLDYSCGSLSKFNFLTLWTAAISLHFIAQFIILFDATTDEKPQTYHYDVSFAHSMPLEKLITKSCKSTYKDRVQKQNLFDGNSTTLQK